MESKSKSLGRVDDDPCLEVWLLKRVKRDSGKFWDATDVRPADGATPSASRLSSSRLDTVRGIHFCGIGHMPIFTLYGLRS